MGSIPIHSRLASGFKNRECEKETGIGFADPRFLFESRKNSVLLGGCLFLGILRVVRFRLGLGREDHLGFADHILQLFHRFLGIRLGFKTNRGPGKVFVFVVADGDPELAILAFLVLDDAGALLGGRFLFLGVGCEGG